MSEWRFDIVHAKFFPLSMYRSGLKPKYSNTQFIQFSYIYIGKKINGYVAACSLESQDLLYFRFKQILIWKYTAVYSILPDDGWKCAQGSRKRGRRDHHQPTCSLFCELYYFWKVSTHKYSINNSEMPIYKWSKKPTVHFWLNPP